MLPACRRGCENGHGGGVGWCGREARELSHPLVPLERQGEALELGYVDNGGGRRGARRGSGDEARIRARSEGFRRGAHREQDGEVAGGNGAATMVNSTEISRGSGGEFLMRASPRARLGLNWGGGLRGGASLG